MDLLILGLGFSGRAVVRAAGPAVAMAGTVRSAERAAAMTASGVDGRAVEVLPYAGGEGGGRLREVVAGAGRVLISAPPGEGGDPVLAGLGEALGAARPSSLVYLSTVGVYGDRGGAWVDEQTEPRPTSRRSVLRVEAERAWTAWGEARGVPVAILRLAGIYGPGSSAIDSVRDGTARRIIKPGQVFNRIHVDDIAAAVWAAFERRFSGVVNVCDDEPAPPQDVIELAATLLGLPVPPGVPIEQAGLSPAGMSFYDECKRVSNRRLKETLGVSLRYPSYRVALPALTGGGDLC